MLNALTFDTRIKKFDRLLPSLLPVQYDLLAIIYLELNRWTNFTSEFILNINF